MVFWERALRNLDLRAFCRRAGFGKGHSQGHLLAELLLEAVIPVFQKNPTNAEGRSIDR